VRAEPVTGRLTYLTFTIGFKNSAIIKLLIWPCRKRR